MINTSLLLQALGQHLAVFGDSEQIKVVPQYPKSIADFADKRSVVVLMEQSVDPPPGCDRVVPVSLRAIAWAKEQAMARHVADIVAMAIKEIPSNLCMRDQALTASPIVRSIGPTSYQAETDLWYRVVSFSVRVST